MDWTTTHISHLGAATLFIGMPGLVAIVGCATLLLVWHEDQALRRDAIFALTVLRRHLTISLVTAATLLAGAILMLTVVHIATD